MTTSTVDSRDFPAFLHWLVDVKGYVLADVLHVVEKPHRYAVEFSEFQDVTQDRGEW